MTEKQARAVLKLGDTFTVAEVRAAFVARCNEAHPDTGGTGGDLASVIMARDLLMGKAKSDITCNACRSRGYIRTRFGAVPCTVCRAKR